MIYEARINLRNKTKEELIMFVNEGLETISKYQAELEKKDKKLHSLEWDLRNIKRDLDFEPWSIYQVEGDILFDMVQQVENKVEREGK